MRRASALWKSATVVACVLIVTACGGGSGGGSDPTALTGGLPSAPASPALTPDTTSNTTTISGAVTKGPVSGATLQLFNIDTFGQPLGEAIATGDTTADGNFSISVPANSSTLLVVSSGGSFIDESDQEPNVALKRRIQLADNQVFLSLLAPGQTAVAVTPFTTALVLRGRILGGPDGSFLTKFDASKAALDTQAGFDIVATIPANPVAPAADATEAQKQYALLLGGLANLTNNVAVRLGASAPTYDMVVAITFDIVDGQFDGLSFGEANVPGPILLPTDLDFTAEVNRFRNNNFDNFTTTTLPSIEVTTFGNTAPIANAGVEVTISQSAIGQLDGSASSDSESGIFYNWVQVSGTALTLSDPMVVAPTFTIPEGFVGSETLVFELTVADAVGAIARDTVNVNVINTAPIANAGFDLDVPQSVAGQLDGSASLDAETSFTYSWAQTLGSTVTLSDPAVPAPTFTAPQRLVGNETLTFELTVTDGFGVVTTDSVNATVTGAVPSVFYIVNNEDGPGVGEIIDGGSKATLNPDGTGSLLDDAGTVAFTYTTAGNLLTLTFPVPVVADDFDEVLDIDGDGIFDDEFLVEELVDFLELTLAADTPNADIFNVRESGTRIFTPIAADDTKAPEPFEFNDPITVYDPSQATPFSFADGHQRTLAFNAFSVIDTLMFSDELYHEAFTFNANGTGTTVITNVTFTYSINADGSLNIVFVNGESARYINLATLPAGDVVVAEYTLTTPLSPDDEVFIADVRLSLARSAAAPLPTTRADLAGIFSGTINIDGVENANLDVRLNPDGTGSIQFDTPASNLGFDFDDAIVGRSGFGACWDVDAAGAIEVNRARSVNTFPDTGSSETTPTFCAALTEATIGFQFNLTQFDSDGTTFKHLDARTTNRCFGTQGGTCTESPVLDTSSIQIRVGTRVPLNATPPVAGIDRVQTPDATPITVDVLANDVARDLAIDSTTVTVVRGPFLGVATVNPVSGAITYTPNPGISRDIVQYFVRDSGGNRSQTANFEIVVTPCAEINGQRGSFNTFSGDCDYSGLTGASNATTIDVNLDPLPDGGVHRFTDSLFIGEDFGSDAALATAGISQGGDGPSLNIAAGTTLVFNNPTDILSIRRGAQINVAGTPTAPVIITSQSDIQSKRNVETGGVGFQNFEFGGQWGGLVIHGFGVTNACAYTGAVSTSDLAISGECHVLSDAGVGTYGGSNNADSSGALNYLQVKYAGGFFNGEAIGAFGIYGAGSATAINNVEVYAVDGDSLQLIGGAPNLQNFVSLYARAASVAIDEGYQGSVSNALLIQGQSTGAECVLASGIVDGDLLSPPQVDALITQGVNSRPNLTNLTCVVSASFFNSGRGLNFFNGTFATVTDSMIMVPGLDDGANIGYCVGSEDRSLLAIQDGDANIMSSLFACPDRTDGEVLPNSTPLDAFLTASGNQFATLPTGVANLPPVAGTSNVLLEGAPLIYSAQQANLQIDSSATTVTPSGLFIGAVQQGTSDWTLNWTFGLHPDSRLASLWYDGPILDVTTFINTSKGQTVVLDASRTIAVALPIIYSWTQTSGTSVVLSDATTAAPSFLAPTDGTTLRTPDESLEFQLIATDANGAESTVTVFVQVQGFVNPCAIINGQLGTFFEASGDCDYSGLTGPGNSVMTDLNLDSLIDGGVHRFSDSLMIGQDFSSDAALAAAGISQGGDGPSLNIAAGATLSFVNGDSVISVRRGAQINVAGTPTAPVIMTSQFDIDNQRNIANGGASFTTGEFGGQWGGLVIHGFGVTNACTYTGTVSNSDLAVSGECHILSDSGFGTYGGVNNTASSGVLSYLQVKYAGGFANGGPIGALGLFGAGSGTVINNVEVYAANGDGLQLIGGAANLQNYVGLYVTEAAIGIDEGYQGSVSNALLIQAQGGGKDCLVASGIVDADLLTPAEVDALIAQGLNSRPVLSNLTCVVSAPFFEAGQGLSLSNGAFATLTDTLVTAPGLDDGGDLGSCIGSADRSLQAVQDGDVAITNNIFACPDRTDGEVLPSSTSLEAFLVNSGNQFATLPTGVTNLPPVVGTSNILLEGAPLIYAAPQASLQVDGSPTTVAPSGSFIGAVQQGANDWTLDWTFGLHPGFRVISLWYEGPIFNLDTFQRGAKGETLTIDASDTVAVVGPIAYAWTQVTGTPGVLSNETTDTLTFVLPGAGLNLTVPGEFFELSLIATDANGLESTKIFTVRSGTPIPSDFYMAAESIIPFRFNKTIEGGQLIEVRADNTGTFKGDTSTEFSWTDTPTTFTMDFVSAGGLIFAPVTNFRDVSASPGQEQVIDSLQLDSIELTFVAEDFRKQIFQRSDSGVRQVFNVTDGVALPDDTFVNELIASSTTSIVALDDSFGFCCAGQVKSLPVNLTPTVPTLLNPNLLARDQLNFIDDSNGFARLKAQAFTYMNTFPAITVNFADGEVGEYTLLFDSPSGIAAGVQYTRLDNSVITTVDSSVTDDVGFNWVVGSVAGIYTSNQRVELNDGTFFDTKLFYRLHPEGTGQLEIETVNLANGVVEDIAVESAGICWQVDLNGDLIFARTSASDERFVGSQVPSLSTCSSLNTSTPDNTLIDFSRTNKLIASNGTSQRLTFVEDNVNQCNPFVAGCDPTQLDLRDTFQRIFDLVIAFIGNPPLAVPDDISGLSGNLIGSPVHANDLAGDSAIVPTSVTIVAGPTNGTASVDGPTGDILYTSNGGFTGIDTIYYRVLDASGNLSTIGTLTITVM